MRRVPCGGVSVYLAGLRAPDGHVIVISNVRTPQILADYTRRWEIETLFACLKTRGFRLESTHLRDLQRISKLFALLAVAFCWCYRIGIWLNEQKSIRICTHQRLAHSLFRHGLDHLRHICLNAHHRKGQFMHMLRLLSCT